MISQFSNYTKNYERIEIMAKVIAYDEILSITEQIFTHTGFKKEYAAEVANNLVSAEGRGVYSHGLVQIKPYVGYFKAGQITNEAPEIIRDFGAVATIDAKFCPGAVAGNYAFDIALEKAKQFGIGMTTVKNGTHFGMAYHYAKRALEDNFIGLSFTNAGALVAPAGGKSRQLGTNPICFVSPSLPGRQPIVFDAATSVQAFNKVFFAKVENRDIPLGWALDANGNDTTNAEAAMGGALLPFGDYKGFGLGFIINLLTGFLSGASISYDEEHNFKEQIQNIGYNFIAIDISKFTDLREYLDGVAAFSDRIKNSPKRDGVDEIFLPGEIEFAKERKAKAEGITIYDGVYNNIKVLCEEYQINF